jgi:hypothetical protein
MMVMFLHTELSKAYLVKRKVNILLSLLLFIELHGYEYPEQKTHT